MNHSDCQSLYILDYSTGKLHDYLVAPGVIVDDDYVAKLGYKDTDIAWMIAHYGSTIYHSEMLK